MSDLHDCACFNLRKAARAVTQLYDDVLRPTGLRVTQFSLLAVIRLSGVTGITALATAAVMDRTTLTRNLRVLAKKGLIQIRDGDDARVREVTLTAGGRAKLAAAQPYWEQAQSHMTSVLGRARMAGLLAHMADAVEAGRARVAEHARR
ncbi:MAG: MarR family winged helix-turn-helix transcriptional regulator [Acidimicrobiales bacterium]